MCIANHTNVCANCGVSELLCVQFGPNYLCALCEAYEDEPAKPPRTQIDAVYYLTRVMFPWQLAVWNLWVMREGQSLSIDERIQHGCEMLAPRQLAEWKRRMEDPGAESR